SERFIELPAVECDATERSMQGRERTEDVLAERRSLCTPARMGKVLGHIPELRKRDLAGFFERLSIDRTGKAHRETSKRFVVANLGAGKRDAKPCRAGECRMRTRCRHAVGEPMSGTSASVAINTFPFISICLDRLVRS